MTLRGQFNLTLCFNVMKPGGQFNLTLCFDVMMPYLLPIHESLLHTSHMNRKQINY